MKLEQVGHWIGRQLLTTRALSAEVPEGLPAIRYTDAQTLIERCGPQAEGAFRIDGQGLSIAFLGTGLPPDNLSPFTTMTVHPIGQTQAVDPTGHDRLNYLLLRQWLPRAHYHLFALKPLPNENGGLGVSDRHIDEALEECKTIPHLDFIIASVAPSHPRFLSNIHLFTPGANAEPIIAFWPTGNWQPGTAPTQRYTIGSVNRNVIVTGQIQQLRFLGWTPRLFSIPRQARYDREHNLPHFWAPGPGLKGTIGSSYSTVPIALVWIQFALILRFLHRHGIVGAATEELTEFIRRNLKHSRSGKNRILAWGRPSFPRATKGLIHLPTAIKNSLVPRLGGQKTQRILSVLFGTPNTSIALGPLSIASIGLMAGAVLGFAYHAQLWSHYAPFLDLFHFANWTYTVAATKPSQVMAYKSWSAAAGALALALTGWRLGHILRGR